MCGIVGYAGKKESREVLLEGLKRLEYRGYDSAGIALAQPAGIGVYKSKGRLERLVEMLNALPALPGAQVGIGHTRWATHGEPSDTNSHPHAAAKVTLVHNGIVENYDRLKTYLVGKGYAFVSQTDTEVLVKLLDSHYHGDPIAAIQQTMRQVRGSFALAILFADRPDTIYATRRESPLIVAYGEGESFLASDIPALLPYTRRYSVLENEEIAVLTQDGVAVYDEFGNQADKEILTADFSAEAAEKGGYAHFMLKEIHEQPEAVLAAVRPRIQGGLPDFGLDGLEEALQRTGRIHIVACGTAMHAGMVGKSAIERMARVPVEVDIASEFRYRNPILHPDDLVVIISQSGETVDTLAALRYAKQMGNKTLAVVNVVGSSIARAADWVVYSHAGPEIAVASTKAYTVQLCCLYLLALQLSLAKGTLDEAIVRHLVAELLRTPALLVPILEACEEIQYLASETMNCDDMFFMGRGIDYALSLEGSLKLKEISYIHSEACAAGELKHGPISLITQGTPVLALATQDDVFEKTVSNVQEVKSRGARVILFCKQDAQVPEGCADHIVRLPCAEGVFMPLVLAVPLQLFAYYTSCLRGCDVDKPRNLAKSVTVE